MTSFSQKAPKMCREFAENYKKTVDICEILFYIVSNKNIKGPGKRRTETSLHFLGFHQFFYSTSAKEVNFYGK